MLRIYTAVKPATSIQKRFFVRVAARDAIKAQSDNLGVFIDLRPPVDFHQLGPPGFTNIPHYAITEKLSTINKFDILYLLDTSGFYSEKTARILDNQRFTDVRIIEGGLLDWVYAGGPITSEVPELKAKFTELHNLPPKMAAIQAHQEAGETIDTSSKMYPLLHRFYTTKEEQAQATANSKARRQS